MTIMRYDPAIPCDGSGLVSTNIALSRQCCLGNHLELQFAKLLLLQIRRKGKKRIFQEKSTWCFCSFDLFTCSSCPGFYQGKPLKKGSPCSLDRDNAMRLKENSTCCKFITFTFRFHHLTLSNFSIFPSLISTYETLFMGIDRLSLLPRHLILKGKLFLQCY